MDILETSVTSEQEGMVDKRFARPFDRNIFVQQRRGKQVSMGPFQL